MSKAIKFSLLSYLFIIGVVLLFLARGGSYDGLKASILCAACMFVPLLSVMIMQCLSNEPLLKGIGCSWCINRWWFVGWLFVPLFVLATIAVSSLMPGVQFTTQSPLVTDVLHHMSQVLPQGVHVGWGLFMCFTFVNALIAGLTINALFAFGEEVGWRGYLLRALSGYSFFPRALLTGVIWGLWHAPLILLGHNYPSHPVLGIFMMVVFCVGLSPLLQYLRLKSRSVIAVAIAHGTLNAFAGLPLLCLDGYDELLTGVSGLAGFIVLAVSNLLLFLYDKYLSKEHLLASS